MIGVVGGFSSFFSIADCVSLARLMKRAKSSEDFVVGEIGRPAVGGVTRRSVQNRTLSQSLLEISEL
jgi:hypothetical protein